MRRVIEFINQKKLAGLIIILVLTTLAYTNIFSNQFVWDDPDFYGNWPALYSFEHVPDLLAGELPTQHSGVYRPARSVLQLFIFQSLGQQTTNPFPYHLISLLIHLAGVIAVYFLVEILTEKRILAFFAALIFGLHPIHTESITYFTTSVDVIGAVLFLWSIYFYYKSQESKKIFYLISLVFGWLAFFTYEITLILPLALILIDLFKENFDWLKLKDKIKFYLPYWLGVLVWLIARVSLNIGVRALSSTTATDLPTRLLTISKAIMKYLYLLFIPYPLNVYHKITFAQNFEPKVVLSVIAIVALLLLAIVLSKKQKIISFSIFWFFLSLAPVANVFPTGIIMAEKYAYLASISTCLILGWLVYLLIKADQKTVKITGLLIALAIAIFYGSLTYARNFDWKNDEALWLKTLSQRPDYGRVYNNLGFVYYKQRNLEKALAYLEKARELEPNLAIVYQNLGNTYDELGDYSQAIENYEKVIELFPDFAEGYNNLGVSFQKSGDLDEALENFQKAVEKDPSYFIAYSNIGVVYLITQDYPAAKEYFQKALEINPGYSLAKQGLLQVNELMR